jgi:DNA primase
VAHSELSLRRPFDLLLSNIAWLRSSFWACYLEPSLYAGLQFATKGGKGPLMKYNAFIDYKLLKIQKLSTIPPTSKLEEISMQSKWVDFKELKSAVPITAVLEHYGIDWMRPQGAKAAGELRGRCPIHAGDNPDSFSVNTKKNIFQCFGCGAKGNVLDLVAAMEKCNMRDAGLKLHTWFAGGKPLDCRGVELGQTKTGKLDIRENTERKLAREKTGSQQEETANKPLTFELRGIDHTHAYLTERGIAEKTAAEFGVGFFPGKGSMSGRVVIPIHNAGGELVAYAGRAIDGSQPKYKLPAGFHKAAELYNIHRAIATGKNSVVLVEGFFDCMKVWQAGFPCVAAMGSHLSEEQRRLLAEKFSAALLLFDGDAAGIAGAQAGINDLGGSMWVKAVWLKTDQQPDQMSSEELQQLLKI